MRMQPLKCLALVENHYVCSDRSGAGAQGANVKEMKCKHGDIEDV